MLLVINHSSNIPDALNKVQNTFEVLLDCNKMNSMSNCKLEERAMKKEERYAKYFLLFKCTVVQGRQTRSSVNSKTGAQKQGKTTWKK